MDKTNWDCEEVSDFRIDVFAWNVETDNSFLAIVNGMMEAFKLDNGLPSRRNIHRAFHGNGRRALCCVAGLSTRWLRCDSGSSCRPLQFCTRLDIISSSHFQWL